LLAGSGIRLAMPKLSDISWGAGLAALIGIPGLVLYVSAVQLGLSMEVIPTAFTNPWVEAPAMLLWSGANAFGEEIVVGMWLITRLKHLRWPLTAIIGASSLLRAAYHLYQGVTAGFCNIIMGVVVCEFYNRTGRVWPIIIAHFLVDAIAFVGYSFLGDLSIFGL